MQRRVLAFGNNAFGSLDPSYDEPTISRPTEISVACQTVIWTSWSSSIGQDEQGRYWIWGTDPLITSDRKISELNVTRRLKKVLGHDQPYGYLADDGYVHQFDGTRSLQHWDDVDVSGQEEVFAISDGELQIYTNLSDLVSGGRPTARISHPLLRHSVALYALESRCFVHIENSLFEVDENELRLIEDFEGLGIKSICRGGRNRLGVVTEAGEAYFIDTKDKDPGLLSGEADEVRLMGLGSDFDILVTDDKVLVKGSNAFQQLSFAGVKESDVFLEVPGIEAASVTGVICSRWSTFLMIDDA